MTDDMMNLRALVEKTPDADLLREMIGFAAERLMDLEVRAATGARYGKKNPLRLAQRNGYRDRDLERSSFFDRFRSHRSRPSCGRWIRVMSASGKRQRLSQRPT